MGVFSGLYGGYFVGSQIKRQKGIDRRSVVGRSEKIIVRNSNYLDGEYYLCSVVVREENGIAGYGGRETAQ